LDSQDAYYRGRNHDPDVSRILHHGWVLVLDEYSIAQQATAHASDQRQREYANEVVVAPDRDPRAGQSE
jgi:hypothetical protein